MEIEKGTILYIERYDERQNKGTNISLEKFDGKKLVSRTIGTNIEWIENEGKWKIKNYTTRDFFGLYETMTRGDAIDTTLNIHPSEFFIVSSLAPQMTNSEL